MVRPGLGTHFDNAVGGACCLQALRIEALIFASVPAPRRSFLRPKLLSGWARCRLRLGGQGVDPEQASGSFCKSLGCLIDIARRAIDPPDLTRPRMSAGCVRPFAGPWPRAGGRVSAGCQTQMAEQLLDHWRFWDRRNGFQLTAVVRAVLKFDLHRTVKR